MNESIYNLVTKEYEIPKKQPIHKSMHDPTANVTGSTFGCFGTSRLLGAGSVPKKDGALFGPPKPEYNLTTKQTNKRDTSTDSTGRFTYSDKRKDHTPTLEEKPIYGIKSNKDFIVANAVEAILQAPKIVPSKELDYLKKEDYGKPPAYLSKVKEEIRRENDMIDRYVQEHLNGGYQGPESDRLEELSEDERQELIIALKKKWEVINNRFQRISHHVILDTAGQVRRKEQLENELQQLEDDISKLERHGPLLIKK
mmetsp:Transcript_7310/g.6557  ORF Transcript_7310/g.6557 Transcript_7310/m.6557 type:complete len:255 (+) Transcript_7310:75-839(+)